MAAARRLLMWGRGPLPSSAGVLTVLLPPKRPKPCGWQRPDVQDAALRTKRPAHPGSMSCLTRTRGSPGAPHRRGRWVGCRWTRSPNNPNSERSGTTRIPSRTPKRVGAPGTGTTRGSPHNPHDPASQIAPNPHRCSNQLQPLLGLLTSLAASTSLCRCLSRVRTLFHWDHVMRRVDLPDLRLGPGCGSLRTPW
jgi:hypothetical protein